MTHTFSNSLFHLVWSTKNREPLIKNEIKPRLHSYIRKIIDNEGAKLLFINGVEDHIHLLVRTPLTMLVPNLIEKVKPVSTKWMLKMFPESKQFKWQEGYGAFTVGLSNQQAIINYIKNQEEHHKSVSFEEEFMGFLEAHGIPYDKKYFLG